MVSASSCGIESYQYLYPPNYISPLSFKNNPGNEGSIYFEGYEIVYKLYKMNDDQSPTDSTLEAYGNSQLTDSVLYTIFFGDTVNGYRRLFTDGAHEQKPLIEIDSSDGSAILLNVKDCKIIVGSTEYGFVRYIENKDGDNVSRKFSAEDSYYTGDEDLPSDIASGDTIIAAFYAVSYGTEDRITHIFSEPTYIGFYKATNISLL